MGGIEGVWDREVLLLVRFLELVMELVLGRQEEEEEEQMQGSFVGRG